MTAISKAAMAGLPSRFMPFLSCCISGAFSITHAAATIPNSSFFCKMAQNRRYDAPSIVFVQVSRLKAGLLAAKKQLAEGVGFVPKFTIFWNQFASHRELFKRNPSLFFITGDYFLLTL